MSQQLVSTSPNTSHQSQVRSRVIQVIRTHLECGDLRRAGAQAYYWSKRLDTHPYLAPVVERAFEAIRRAQRGEPWQVHHR